MAPQPQGGGMGMSEAAMAGPHPHLAARLAALAPQQPATARRAHVVVPLRTAHLRLRLVTAADVPALQAHWSLAEVRGHLFEGGGIDLDAAARLVAAAQETAEQHEGGLWLATRLDDGRFVGTGALLRLSAHTPLELLLTVEPAARGCGLATEVGQRLLRHAFDELHVAIVLADVNAPNPATRRLAARLGMRAERRASWPGSQFFFIDRNMRAAAGHVRPDWHESQPMPLPPSSSRERC
ncbi:MAG TPA: GNAT family N-acetyltransferase [Burkholderiaceae bacterium]|nr:GNAT family N-acetyltransferase [Burkholderiaceae bacterium]